MDCDSKAGVVIGHVHICSIQRKKRVKRRRGKRESEYERAGEGKGGWEGRYEAKKCREGKANMSTSEQ